MTQQKRKHLNIKSSLHVSLILGITLCLIFSKQEHVFFQVKNLSFISQNISNPKFLANNQGKIFSILSAKLYLHSVELIACDKRYQKKITHNKSMFKTSLQINHMHSLNSKNKSFTEKFQVPNIPFCYLKLDIGHPLQSSHYQTPRTPSLYLDVNEIDQTGTFLKEHQLISKSYKQHLLKLPPHHSLNTLSINFHLSKALAKYIDSDPELILKELLALATVSGY